MSAVSSTSLQLSGCYQQSVAWRGVAWRGVVISSEGVVYRSAAERVAATGVCVRADVTDPRGPQNITDLQPLDYPALTHPELRPAAPREMPFFIL